MVRVSSDELEAWSTFAGALFAAAATAVAFVLYVKDRSRDREVEKLANQAQANQIAAWVTPDSRVVLRNASELPVYKAHVTFVCGGLELGSQAFRDTVPPDSSGITATLPLSVRQNFEKSGFVGDDLTAVRVRLTFVDARGIGWIREIDGVLRVDG
jgi:hypothetical protein